MPERANGRSGSPRNDNLGGLAPFPGSLYWTPRQLLEANVFTETSLCVFKPSRGIDSSLLGRGNVFPKGKQLSSKALVNLVTTRTRALVRAWELSGGGVGMGGN